MRSSRLVFCGLAALIGACSSTQDFTTTSASPAPPATDTPGATLPPGAPPSAPTIVTLASDQGLASLDPDRQGAWTVVTDSAFVYWLDAFGEVSRIAKSGGTVSQIAEAAADPSQLRVQDGYVYYSDFEALRVMRIPAAGGAAEAVTPKAAEFVSSFAVDGPRVTWVDSTSVYRCKTLGCVTPEDLFRQPTLHPTSVTTSGDDVFVPYLVKDPNTPGQWLDTGGIMNATGGGQVSTLTVAYETIVTEADAARPGLTAVYASASHLIVQADWPGGFAARVLVSGEDAGEYPYNLQLSGSYVYWLDRGSRCSACKTLVKGAIRRIAKDGTGRPETVWAGDDVLNSLVVDQDGLYVSTNDGRILRIPRPSDAALP